MVRLLTALYFFIGLPVNAMFHCALNPTFVGAWKNTTSTSSTVWTALINPKGYTRAPCYRFQPGRSNKGFPFPKGWINICSTNDSPTDVKTGYCVDFTVSYLSFDSGLLATYPGEVLEWSSKYIKLFFDKFSYHNAHGADTTVQFTR